MRIQPESGQVTWGQAVGQDVFENEVRADRACPAQQRTMTSHVDLINLLVAGCHMLAKLEKQACICLTQPYSLGVMPAWSLPDMQHHHLCVIMLVEQHHVPT